MEKFSLAEAKVAIIIGAGHGIGLALARQLLKSHKSLFVYTTYREIDKASELIELGKRENSRLLAYQLDPLDEERLSEFSNMIITKWDSVDLVVNCIGFLESNATRPEKSLGDITPQSLIEYFKVNSIITPLIAKHFTPLLKSSHISCFAILSAKVGSIEDNEMGGWYGYRSSKAALNMLIKNIAIEFKRKRSGAIILALHPGTTQTNLSQNYIRNTKYKIHQPHETAINLLSIIDQKSIDDSGSFFSWNGEIIPW